MSRHSIEAGYERGKFWRQAPFVEVGEPVVWNKHWRSAVLKNTLMGEFDDATGDEPESDEIDPQLIRDAMYVLNAVEAKKREKLERGNLA